MTPNLSPTLHQTCHQYDPQPVTNMTPSLSPALPQTCPQNDHTHVTSMTPAMSPTLPQPHYQHYPKPVTTMTPATAAPIVPACSKCGVSKKSGKLSCCARGGAWFKNCGDIGDSKFDHAWSEGMQACEGKLMIITNKIPRQPTLGDCCFAPCRFSLSIMCP